MHLPSKRLDTFPKDIFLTGATGVLGARLLKDLLQWTSCRIVCLARGNDADHARARVRAFLTTYDSQGELDRDFQARVSVLCGDVTQDRLGLSEIQYVRLQNETELTIHAAANTSLLVKYKRLEPINVHGTGRVIEFCLGTQGKNLAYVSTYTVMGDKTFDREVRFCERDFELGQGFDHLNYQRSKFRAEGMVRAAQARGLKWRIFRPGQIYGDSVTGAYPLASSQVSGLFYDLFRTAMDTRVMPESYIHYDIVPVDYVSRGIVALCAGVDNVFEVYHLTNPDIRTFSEIMGLLRELGYPIELLPEDIYKQRLQRGEITRGGHQYRSTMLQAFTLWYFTAGVSFYDSAITECEFTRAALEKLGVTCAPIDRRLMETYVKAGIRSGYFPTPSQARLHDASATVDVPPDVLGLEGLRA